MGVKVSGSMPFEAGVAMAENIMRLGDENIALRQLLRDYQVWGQDGIEAMSALSSAVNCEIWQERYVALNERAKELMGGQYETAS